MHDIGEVESFDGSQRGAWIQPKRNLPKRIKGFMVDDPQYRHLVCTCRHAGGGCDLSVAKCDDSEIDVMSQNYYEERKRRVEKGDTLI